MNGKGFKAWRVRCGYSLDRAADALGVSKKTIQRIEKSDDVPSLIALATAQIESSRMTTAAGAGIRMDNIAAEQGFSKFCGLTRHAYIGGLTAAAARGWTHGLKLPEDIVIGMPPKGPAVRKTGVVTIVMTPDDSDIEVRREGGDGKVYRIAGPIRTALEVINIKPVFARALGDLTREGRLPELRRAAKARGVSGDLEDYIKELDIA